MCCGILFDLFAFAAFSFKRRVRKFWTNQQKKWSKMSWRKKRTSEHTLWPFDDSDDESEKVIKEKPDVPHNAFWIFNNDQKLKPQEKYNITNFWNWNLKTERKPPTKKSFYFW